MANAEGATMNDDFSDITASRAGAKKNSASTPHAVTGTILRVTIIAESWDKPGTMETLNCGSFEVDGITLDGPPSTATIKGVSVPLAAPVRREAKTRGWEDVTLRQVGSDVAANGGLALMYELDDDPELDRVDQRQQPDLAFLKELCADHGASVKVVDGKLVIFDKAKYEAREPAFTFKRGDGRLINYSFTQDSSDVASSATVSYKDPKSGKLVEETFTPDNAPAVGQKLRLSKRPSRVAGETM